MISDCRLWIMWNIIKISGFFSPGFQDKFMRGLFFNFCAENCFEVPLDVFKASREAIFNFFLKNVSKILLIVPTSKYLKISSHKLATICSHRTFLIKFLILPEKQIESPKFIKNSHHFLLVSEIDVSPSISYDSVLFLGITSSQVLE